MVVTVQRYTSMDDGFGGSAWNWANHLTLEGTLDQLSGDEVLAAEKLGQVSSHVFIVFDIVDVQNSDRFIINDDIYQITNVDNPNNLDYQLEITLRYTGEKYEVQE
jgi:SPP1 family predicted phage head-tail adaptor